MHELNKKSKRMIKVIIQFAVVAILLNLFSSIFNTDLNELLMWYMLLKLIEINQQVENDNN